MDTNRLRQFKVIAETGNLRRAAEILTISHAGLSKSLRTLEEELQTPLTVRDGRGIRISTNGQKLLKQMSICLDAEDSLRAAAKGLTVSKQNTSVRIGTFEVFSTYLAPTLANLLGTTRNLELQELIPGQLESALSEGRIDYGITYLPIPTRGIEHIEINQIAMGIFASPVSGLQKLPLEEIPFVVPISKVAGAPTRVQGLDGWPDDRVPRKVRYQVTLMETALSLVRQGLAAAYLPRFIVGLHNDCASARYHLEEIQTRKPVASKQPVYAMRRHDREEDRDFRAICKALRKL